MASDPAVPLHGSGPDAAIARTPEPRRRRWFGLRAPAGEAIRTLRLLLLGSILAPLLVLVGGSYLAYKTTVDHARTDLIETVAIAEENVIKVLDTHALVAARVSDLLGGLSDEAIRAREKELHDSLRLQIADLPQVETAWAVDRTGHLLVGGRNYPAGGLDLSDRDYFRALREPGPEVYIGGLQSRFDAKPFFAVARRRIGPAGEFEGVVVVAVSPAIRSTSRLGAPAPRSWPNGCASWCRTFISGCPRRSVSSCCAWSRCAVPGARAKRSPRRGRRWRSARPPRRSCARRRRWRRS